MSYTKYHPVYLDLNGRTVLIVGGGKIAIEKLESLLPSGALITVVSPVADTRVQDWHREQKLNWVQKRFEESDATPAYMIIAATNDPEVNAHVYRTGNALLRLTNSVDDPQNCNFIMAAISKAGPIQAAISSAGCSPAIAQRVRNRIATEILTEELGELTAFLGERRALVKKALPTYKYRQAFWESVIDSDIPCILATHGVEKAHIAFVQRINQANCPRIGKVTLIGAGPGDPGLITVKGAQALGRADAILYDRLANPALLKYAKPSAELIYAGKDLGSPGAPRQIAIHEKLIALAREGKNVVRLKGGDPFVFGRGGEEAMALKDAGIEWEVISGVTSSIAAPAAANIPVSHRKIAPAFGVFAGQEADDKQGDGIPWAAAALMPTAIFLMGVERLPHITAQLIAHGRSPDTPVAAVSNGTLPTQKIVTGTLKDICSKADELVSPATIVVGDVVKIAEYLATEIEPSSAPKEHHKPEPRFESESTRTSSYGKRRQKCKVRTVPTASQ